jgi:hypothetical protein
MGLTPALRACLDAYGRAGRVPDIRPDWTVVLDDVAGHRIQTCTGCGGHLEVFTLETWANGTVTAAGLVYLPCQRADPRREAVCATLESRYDPARWSAP